MNAYSLNRAAAVALAVSAAGCGTGVNVMNDNAHAQLLAASDPLPAEGGAGSATAATGKAAAVEPQSGTVAQRHFDLYQRFHGLTPEASAAQAHAADKQLQTFDERTAAMRPPNPPTAGAKPVSSGE